VISVAAVKFAGVAHLWNAKEIMNEVIVFLIDICSLFNLQQGYDAVRALSVTVQRTLSELELRHSRVHWGYPLNFLACFAFNINCSFFFNFSARSSFLILQHRQLSRTSWGF